MLNLPIFIAVATLLSVATSAAASAQSLSGIEIQATLSDKRVALTCVDGTTGSGRYTMARHFGTITGSYRAKGGEATSDTGRVRASGDSVCLTFQKLNGGAEQCFTVSQKARGRFQFSVGPIAACEVRVL